jgi:hypothetical protein
MTEPRVTLPEPIVISRIWKSPRDRKNTIVISLKQYEGHTFLDCRIFGTNSEGQSVPTAKGVTVGMARLPEGPCKGARAWSDRRRGRVMSDRRRATTVIPLHIPRIVREPDAPGWLVIYRSFGWLYGSRGEAVSAARDLSREVQS